MSAEKHSESTNVPNGDGRSNVDSSVVLASRRRMLRRSLTTVAPVVATLASGPVAAGVCLNASGFVSANTANSRHPNLSNCQGLSPSAWASQSTWPVNKSSQKFNDVFASGNLYMLTIGTDDKPTLMQALSGPNVLAQDVAAAWLNAMSGVSGYVITTSQAIAIWQALCSGSGTYSPPNVTMPWSLAQTKAWLEMSWKP